ncbi:hypothetical protein HY441_00880 [Candidatus Microgenomates bacterium]|nr:hypothetical protein [Candidatus Microgenomates bacterium]
MTNQAKAVSDLLHEVAELHHKVYRLVDGDDPDWASWYAEWLIDLSELPKLLGTKPVKSQLVYLLVELDKDFIHQRISGRWEDYYAAGLIKYFAKK